MSNLDVSTQSLISSRNQSALDYQKQQALLSDAELIELGEQAIDELFS